MNEGLSMADLASAGAGVGAGVGAVLKSGAEFVFGVLSRACNPLAEEAGLLFRDRVREYRFQRLESFARKLEQKLDEQGVGPSEQASPRLAAKILEEASWVEDSFVQDMWAGLLASACSEDGKDDSNIPLVSILGNMSSLEVKVVKYICESAKKQATPMGWVLAEPMWIKGEVLAQVLGTSDMHRIDRELDHLKSLGMFAQMNGGFSPHGDVASVTPSALCLNLFMRCQGFRGEPAEFYKVPIPGVEVPREATPVAPEPTHP